MSMYVHTEMYNLQYGEKLFLSTGETNLSMLYFLFFLTLQFTCMKKKKKPIINKIHIIMSALLLFKELAIICAFPRLYIREINWYLSWLGCSICAFLVLQGYTAFQCHCPYRHWMIVLPLQVLEYIAYVV